MKKIHKLQTALGKSVLCCVLGGERRSRMEKVIDIKDVTCKRCITIYYSKGLDIKRNRWVQNMIIIKIPNEIGKAEIISEVKIYSRYGPIYLITDQGTKIIISMNEYDKIKEAVSNVK